MIRFFIICLLATFVWAEGTVKVNVDRRKINEGDSITLTVTATNIIDDPDVSLPEMKDFKIVSGPNQSSSTNVQFVNGKMTKSSTVTLTWTLIPVTIGQVTVPTIKIQAGKKSFASSPITVTISKRGTRQTGTKPQFFIEAAVDNITPFRGQQVTLTYILYTQVDVSSFDDELPKYKGFWTEELFAAKNLQLREVQKNGSKYYAATIKKLALFPTQSGKLIIDPLTAIIGIRDKQQRWNDFSLFGPPSKKYTIATNRIELEVQPVPARKNGEMSAVVGNWNIQSVISTTNVVQDEAVTFQVKVNGTGNIQTVNISNISFPNELEIFAPKIQTKKNPLRDEIGGEKTFEWVLLPRYAGEILIPKIQFGYFDPDKQMWLTKSTIGHRLKVAPSEKSTISPMGLSKEEIALVGQDIRFLNESNPQWSNRSMGLVTGTTLTLLLLSSIVFAFPHAHNYTRLRMEKTSGGQQAKRALKSAIEILDSGSNSPEAIYTHIYKAVITFINMKTGKNRAEYSTGEIKELLDEHDGSGNLQEIEQVLTRGEAVRFSPISSEDAHDDMLKIITIVSLPHPDSSMRATQR